MRANDEPTGLAVLPKDKILGIKRRGRADVGRLLAVIGHVEGDATLALGLVQDPVHGVEQGHVLVHLHHHVLAQLHNTADLKNVLSLNQRQPTELYAKRGEFDVRYQMKF